MPEKDPGNFDLLLRIAQFAWVVFTGLFGFMWVRMNNLQTQILENKKEVDKDISEGDKELNRHKLHIANNYHDKNDLEKMLDAKINPVIEKIDEVKNIVNRRVQ